MKSSTAVTLILAQVAGVWLSALALLAGVGLGEKLVADGAPAWTPVADIAVAVAFGIGSIAAWMWAVKQRDALALVTMGSPFLFGFIIAEITR